MPETLDIVPLRTLVAIADCGGSTVAATVLATLDQRELAEASA